MRKVYVLPNLFTTASLFCGLLAMLNIYDAHYEMACTLILISAVMDALDGQIARLTGTQSYFGLNYDSLSDLVAFGVAPAMLIYSWLQAATGGTAERIATGVASLYAICGALRLARFNVQALRVEKKSFTGLPIPAAAGAVVATFLAFWKMDFFFDKEDHLFLRFLPIVFIGLSYLMVSNIPYPSLKHIDLERRKPFDYLVSVIIILCLIVALWQMRTLILFLGFWSYVIWGVLGRLVRVRKPREDTVPQVSGGKV